MQMVRISRNNLVQAALTRLRDVKSGKEKVRQEVKRIATILTIEALADISLQEGEVLTPMKVTAPGYYIERNIVLVPIKRAGTRMAQASEELLRDLFPSLAVCEIGIRRVEGPINLTHRVYSENPPSAEIRSAPFIAVIFDPMLATGGSACVAIARVKSWGASEIFFIGIIGVAEGIERIRREHPEVPINLAAIDPILLPNWYISPGMGDAGDRQDGPPPELPPA